MLGELNSYQIEDVLHSQVIGRIGCHANDRTYVVPISYAYDGVNIFARSNEGFKIEIMRANPGICFEVENIKDLANWKTVILWGNFVEILDEEERRYALEKLLRRRLPILSGEMSRFTPNWPFNPDNISSVDGVVYRVDIIEKTGRFENYEGTEEISAPFL